MKKFWVLFALLIGPLLFYLLILQIKQEFKRLPVLNKEVTEISAIDSIQTIQFKNHINIVGFIGNNALNHKTSMMNINEKIYKRFYKFHDFQLVLFVTKGSEDKVEAFKKKIALYTNLKQWKFVFLTKEKIQKLFHSFKSKTTLQADNYSANFFIVDKDGFQRGRDDDEDTKDFILYSYNSESVSTIHKKMVDDVKVLLAEYRLALKRNKKKEHFINPYKKKTNEK